MAGWLKTREARTYCAMGEKTFAKAIKSGSMAYVRLPSGHLRFHPEDLDQYMRQFQVNGKVSKEVKDAADEIMRKL